MIRFAWIQARSQTAVVALGMTVLAIALIITGPHLVHAYDTAVAPCASHNDCATATNTFLGANRTMWNWMGIVVLAVPGILGVFWGAPLISRELETGTYRLAWTQSVTRTRWLATRLAVVGLVTAVAAGLVSLMVTWWASPLDKVSQNIYANFDQRDIMPIALALFAFALGVAAGLIIRRSIPAMAATLVAFVGVRIAFYEWVQYKILAPVHKSFPLGANSVVGYGNFNGGPNMIQFAPPNLPNTWLSSTELVNSSGHQITTAFVDKACPSLLNAGANSGGSSGALGLGGSGHQVQAAGQGALHQCALNVAAVYHEVVVYQPASRYWELQWLEFAIFVAAAAAIAGLCVYWVRNRLS